MRVKRDLQKNLSKKQLVVIEIAVTFDTIMQVWCLLRFRNLVFIPDKVYLWWKTKKLSLFWRNWQFLNWDDRPNWSLGKFSEKGFLVSDTLFNQKSPALLVPVVAGGDKQHIHTRTSRPLDRIGLGADAVKSSFFSSSLLWSSLSRLSSTICG